MNWRGRRVLLTGHTGFKGSWLALWLQMKGADVCGVALEPPTQVNLYQDAAIASAMRSEIGDIRDLALLTRLCTEHRPEVIFHLAAQPLVRASYENPVETYSTNVMGTVNVLEAARKTNAVRAVVVITTDKCYENKEWHWPYREVDRLGGYDPYSNSKACAEMVVSAYRRSFFHPDKFSEHGVALASVRAGNVIGGGDWAAGRLVPDVMRAFMEKQVVQLRNPHAIRPWQHVLEPLRGYLRVADSLCEDGVVNAEAWNFGPAQSDARPVGWIVRELARIWGQNGRWEMDEGDHPHEASTLKLDCSKAAARLGWLPILRLEEALMMTADWYQERRSKTEMRSFTCAQIEAYEQRAEAVANHGARQGGECA